jgi:hypothetical protein
MTYEQRISRAHKALRLGIVALAIDLSGCASTAAPAPVEQRQPTRDAATLTTPSPARTTPSRSHTAGGESTLNQVQIIALGSTSTSSIAVRDNAVAQAAGQDSGQGVLAKPVERVVPAPAGQNNRSTVATAPAPQRAFAVANPAVVALLNRANRDSAAGRQGASAASLERAIKIEPGNAWLWHRLAQTRLKQHRPEQAASIAARSNSLAGADHALRARNWRLIASVHQQGGKPAAARAAQRKAEDLESGTS